MSILKRIEYPDGKIIAVEVMDLREFNSTKLSRYKKLNVIAGEPYDWDYVRMLFTPLNPGDLFLTVPREITWPQLLTAIGLYRSSTEAIKDWCKKKGNLVRIHAGLNVQPMDDGLRLHVWKPFRQSVQA